MAVVGCRDEAGTPFYISESYSRSLRRIAREGEEGGEEGRIKREEEGHTRPELEMFGERWLSSSPSAGLNRGPRELKLELRSCRLVVQACGSFSLWLRGLVGRETLKGRELVRPSSPSLTFSTSLLSPLLSFSSSYIERKLTFDLSCSLPPGPDGQSQWEHPSSDSSALPSNDPPTVDEPLLPNPSHNPKRRQYAAAQAAYLSSNTNGPGGTFDSSSAAPVGDLAGSTFVPAYGGAAAAGAAPGYGYGDVKSAAGPGGDSGLAGQFGSMGLGGQKPAAGGFEGDLRVSSHSSSLPSSTLERELSLRADKLFCSAIVSLRARQPRRNAARCASSRGSSSCDSTSFEREISPRSRRVSLLQPPFLEC